MKKLIVTTIIFLSLCSTSFGQQSVKSSPKKAAAVVHSSKPFEIGYEQGPSNNYYELVRPMHDQVPMIDTSICTDRQLIKFGFMVYEFRIKTCQNTPWKNQLVIVTYHSKNERTAFNFCASEFVCTLSASAALVTGA